MISEHADHQNRAKRKELEGLGYKFSIGHDGWDVFFGDESIAQGPPVGKGEQKTRSSLDQAIHAAIVHNRDRAIVTTREARGKDTLQLVKDDGLKAVEEPKPITKIARKQVEAAINLLTAAGAQYYIALGEEEFGTVPVKKKRDNYRDFYHPLLGPFKGQGPFTTTLTIPEELDFDSCTKVIGAYLRNHYGSGNYTTEADRTTRMMTILVENAPFNLEET